MCTHITREGYSFPSPDDSAGTLTSVHLVGRFRLADCESEDVLKAVVSAHKLLDGYFRRKIIVADFGHGLPPVIHDFFGPDLGEGVAIEHRINDASLEPLEPYLKKGIHLISHRAGSAVGDLVDRFDPITITTVEQQDEVVITVKVPHEPGSDPSVLPHLERTIRDLLTADKHVIRDAVRQRPHTEAIGQGDLNDGAPLFISRFHDLVDRYPTRPAVEYRDMSLTYAELAQLADRMAQGMVDRGLGKGTRILILAARDPLLVATMIAAFKVGAVMSFLDSKLPELYLETCADILRPNLIIDLAGHSMLGSWGTVPAAEVRSATAPSRQFRADVLAPDDCSIVSFTSGTTGAPKASAGRYGSLTEFFDWMDKNVGPLKDCAFGMCSSLGHDPLQRDIMTPLYLGGRIVIPEEDDLIAPEGLCRWLTTKGVEVVCMNPVMASAMAEAAHDLLPLKVVFFIGSALSRDQAAVLRRAVPRARIFNLYGSTETQRAVSFFEIPASVADVEDLPDTIPLGVGMKNVDILVTAGEERRPCLPFQIGEILIRSRHIALGYLNDNELTSRKFIAGGFESDDTTPVYVTGDLGYLSPRYGVIYVGRIDDQYKINGYRVEPNQVSAICRQHPLVKDAATIVMSVDGLATLVTWLVPHDPEMRVKPLDFRTFLAARLPHYLVPSQIKTLSKLPLTANNKVDSGRLKSMVAAEAVRSAGNPQIMGAAKAFVARHTGLVDVPTDVPLNDLGIDSLRFSTLVSQLDVDPGAHSRSERALFPYMTIDELAAESVSEHLADRAVYPDEEPGSRLQPRDIFGPVTDVSETSISFNGSRFDHLCSNSYLGLNGHQGLREKIAGFVRDSPSFGAHGSAELNGFTIWHERLVAELRNIYEADAALLYSSCYLANISVIPALAGPGDDIFMDKNCHKSIVDGCLLSRARMHVYKHNDARDLKSSLDRANGKHKLIVSEGVFSVEGDILDLPSIHNLAVQYECLLMVDEACSIGQLGTTGRGVEEYFGLPGSINVKVGTLSKALCADGGYAVYDGKIERRLRFQRGAIFSTAPSVLQAFIAGEAARILRVEGRDLISSLARNAETWRRCLTGAGFDIGASTTAIVPIHFAGEQQLTQAYQQALSVGVYCLPVGRPWSAETCALRTSVTAAHDARQLEDVAARLRARVNMR